MYEILLVVYLIIALALIGFVLIQQGKGADMGSSFGAGASGTVLGSSEAGNFMTKTTTMLATVFFVLSIILGNLTASQIKETDEWSNLGSEIPAETTGVTEKTNQDVPVSQNQNSDVPVSQNQNSDVPVSQNENSDVPVSKNENSDIPN